MKFIDYEFLTSDESVKTDNTYLSIKSFLSEMVENGTVNLASGYCISASDMVKTGLKQRGIESVLVECSLAIGYFNEEKSRTDFVGFDHIKHPGQIDTHMVVITRTEPSFLIDAGIANRLPPNKPALIEPIFSGTQKTDGTILETTFEKEKINVTYKEKMKQSFPPTYQKSIVERIETDKRIFSNLSSLKILIIVALVISAGNAVRGAYDFYSVYFAENNWGPRSLESIENRLENLENKLTNK